MAEDKFYGFADDPRPIIIVQQSKREQPPSPAAEPNPEPETKDLASPAKSKRHHNHPTPDIAAITKKYSAELPSTDRHGRKCQICHHPDRASIEEDFLLWCTPRSISVEYRVPEMTLYRHAHAFGLFTVRRESLRLGLDRIVERGAEAPVTGDMVIRAVKAQACLTDDNHWVDPARHMIFSKASQPSDRSSGVRSFSSDTRNGGEAANRCADPPAASSRSLAASDERKAFPFPENGTDSGFHELRITSRESQVLIDSPTIRNEG